jgi:hypothetical protein
MKAFIILALIAIASYSCTDNAKTTDSSGTYVTNFKNEYSVTDDTLIISKGGSSDINYTVQRKSGFQKIRNGVLQDKEFKSVQWQATYDPNDNVLKQTDLGTQIFIFPSNNTVKLGASVYKKVQ